jgi:hypothetical protein
MCISGNGDKTRDANFKQEKKPGTVNDVGRISLGASASASASASAAAFPSLISVASGIFPLHVYSI